MGPRIFQRARRRLRAGARNALELGRLGRLGVPYAAPHEILAEGAHHRLRRYATVPTAHAPEGDGPVALLVPPLMVTAEVYDVAPDVSAVTLLGARGVRPFVVDFGAPEHVPGGLARTLDDHVRAVVEAVDQVRAATGGRAVHLVGYSQGGMFAYQAAAFRRSEGIASVVTFGSPVDIHRGVPALGADVVSAVVHAAGPLVDRALASVEALPGFLTSTAFKLASPRKELTARLELLRTLHDRDALAKREAKRRFLAGEGFVAWPGPAFRTFVEEFIVHNRMLSGGFVVDGRTVTLADIACPVLAFVGSKDDIARPAAVRAVARALPQVDVAFATIRAGHFGLVVGSRAATESWPLCADWIEHVEGRAPRPAGLDDAREAEARARASARDDGGADGAGEGDEDGDDELDLELELFVDGVLGAVRAAAGAAEGAVRRAGGALDTLRFRAPRLRELAALDDAGAGAAPMSPSRALADQARARPDEVFFLFAGRAYTYAQADARVGATARALFAAGVRPGDEVLVALASRPALLSVVTALARLGAVAIVAPGDARASALAASPGLRGVRLVVAEGAAESSALASALGVPARDVGSLEGATAPELPEDLPRDAGRGDDLALVLLRRRGGAFVRCPVTNRRWMLSALGAAATCVLRPGDTVYTCLPLWHPTALLVGVGAALVGGARLALGEPFAQGNLIAEVRRTGASVVFYAGDLLGHLVADDLGQLGQGLPVRLFAGSGARAHVVERVRRRFGAEVLEFYAGTTHRLVLANASGRKPGALGRRLPGSAAARLVRFEVGAGGALAPAHAHGRLVDVADDEPGLLLVRIEPGEPVEEGGEVLRDAFVHDDAWLVTGDVLRRDAEGDHWLVATRGRLLRTPGGLVPARRIEDAVARLPEVRSAVAFDDGGALRLVYAAGGALPVERAVEALRELPAHERPARVDAVARMPLTDGLRPDLEALRASLGGLGARHALSARRATSVMRCVSRAPSGPNWTPKPPGRSQRTVAGRSRAWASGSPGIVTVIVRVAP